MPPCAYCVRGARHPHYVYLLSDSRVKNNPSMHKIVPYIGLSSNPLLKLCAHNRMGRRFGHGSQLTKPGAGHYQLELVYGPIFQGGRAFKATCRKKSRKIISRILHFCDYASSLQRHAGNASLYVRDRALIEKLYRERAQQHQQQALRVVRTSH